MLNNKKAFFYHHFHSRHTQLLLQPQKMKKYKSHIFPFNEEKEEEREWRVIEREKIALKHVSYEFQTDYCSGFSILLRLCI